MGSDEYEVVRKNEHVLNHKASTINVTLLQGKIRNIF